MKQRVATALLLLPAVLLAAFAVSPLPVALICAVVTAIATGELLRLTSGHRPYPWMTAAMVLLVILTAGLAQPPVPFDRALIVMVVPFLLGLIGIRDTLRGGRWRALAGLYPAAGLAALAAVHSAGAVNPGDGPFAWNRVLLLTLPVWAGDTLAIFAGKAFGRHKLAPGVSPNKTVEGALAHGIAGITLGVVTAPFIAMEWWQAGSIGLAISLLAQMGDLLESALKRHAGVKDSGALLPGHGGLLDRIDGLLLSAPVGAFLLYLMGLLR